MALTLQSTLALLSVSMSQRYEERLSSTRLRQSADFRLLQSEFCRACTQRGVEGPSREHGKSTRARTEEERVQVVTSVVLRPTVDAARRTEQQ